MSSRNQFPWKTGTSSSYIVNKMTAYHLVLQGARALVAMALTCFSWNIPVAVPEGPYLNYKSVINIFTFNVYTYAFECTWKWKVLTGFFVRCQNNQLAHDKWSFIDSVVTWTAEWMSCTSGLFPLSSFILVFMELTLVMTEILLVLALYIPIVLCILFPSLPAIYTSWVLIISYHFQQ